MKYFSSVLLVFIFLVTSCGSVKPAVQAGKSGAQKPVKIFEYALNSKSTLSVPTAEKLPQWKGFNLLNLFYLGHSQNDSYFDEEIFLMISELGFNFVRIPIDYRIITKSYNRNIMDESALLRLDKAVEYGIKYDIHICINLHRAPGYTVAQPRELSNLWTQNKPQETFAAIWGHLAERYKKVPVKNLSFNFVNEPPDIDEAVYAAVIKRAADAIRKSDPDRLLIADGLRYGRNPSKMIRELGIAQAARGYEPFYVSHYKADWIDGAMDFPAPVWPFISMPRYLYGIGKPGVRRSIYSIEHEFKGAYFLDVNIGTVSTEARLIVKADGDIIFNRLFISAKGKGEWKTEVYNKEWDVYQNIFDRTYRVEIPEGTRFLTLEVTNGDWLTVNDISFSPVSGNGKTFKLTPNNSGWDELIPHVKLNADGNIIFDGDFIPRKWLWEAYFKQWDELIKSGGVIVGEWGVYNKTPHDTALRWMEDNLKNFKEAGIGWALWNFYDAFGIIHSGRDDVDYVDYRGYKLDRKMLDLLQKYQ